MNEEIYEALKSFGFSDKESRIYLGILEKGMISANEISMRTNINRSTVYDVIRALSSKGIVSQTLKDKTTYFEVASPEKLISTLDEKKEKLTNVLDDLKRVQENPMIKPVVRVYQGYEGVKTILNDILSTKENTDVISTSKVFKILAYKFPQYISQRSEMKIKSRVIQEDSIETNELKKLDKKQLRETKSIKNFDISSMIFIYANKVSTIKLVKDEFLSVNIEDKNITDDNRKIFDLLWEIAN